MNFEVDDLDWAMGELLQLFARANRVGVPPHELDAALFHSAWSVLNAQPIEVRLRCRDTLMFLITRPLLFQSGVKSVKRYANALTH